jgi:adenylosuccinate lyase
VILPDATILLDYLLQKTATLIRDLLVRPERMRDNIERGLGLHASSRVLLALVETAGLAREAAYEVVQRSAFEAQNSDRQLREVLALDPTVARKLSLAELDACFDDTRFLGHVPEVIARLDSLVAREAVGAHR